MHGTNELSIDDIIAAFRSYSGVYERELVDAAIEHREEIVPRLIDVLQTVIANPQGHGEDDNLFDHIYAVMLLGHFKATEAHERIIEAFSLPGGIAEDLFGDICTSDLPMILLRTCGGSLDAIKAMALNKDVSDYCRNSALQAMSYAVPAGIADREEMLEFFGTLFTGTETDSDSDFWGLLACNILELYPEESMAVIERGYEEGLISPGMVGYDAFERALTAGREKTLERLHLEYERDSMDDIHRCMSWWACFQQDEAPRSDPDLASPFFDMPAKTPAKGQKKKNAKTKRKKRKQAKASKRKNRR